MTQRLESLRWQANPFALNSAKLVRDRAQMSEDGLFNTQIDNKTSEHSTESL